MPFEPVRCCSEPAAVIGGAPATPFWVAAVRTLFGQLVPGLRTCQASVAELRLAARHEGRERANVRIYPSGPKVPLCRTNGRQRHAFWAPAAMAGIDPTRGVHLTLPLWASKIMEHPDCLGPFSWGTWEGGSSTRPAHQPY